MNQFEITIQRKVEDSWPVVVERSESETSLPVRSEGVFQFDGGARDELLVHGLNPRAYGTVLGQALFRETIRDVFMQGRAEGQGDLRVLLVVEDPQLKSLHWEWLCAPIRLGGRWDLLALDQQILFSLYLPSLTDRRFPAIGRRDLRALVLVANPPLPNPWGLAHFDVDATVASVSASLGEIPHDVLANIRGALGPPTLDELAARLTEEPYTLLHIVAHGWFSSVEGETILYLLDAQGQIKPLAATHFLERLDQIQGPKGLPLFAFLATCDSAKPEAEAAGALGGLAQRLVRELGLPAVIAMTQKVSIATAGALTSNFYVRLREHGEVDRALVQATAGLADAGDITVPALYSRLAGRPLFSDTLARDLTASEIDFGLAELESLLTARAPVLQEALAAQAATLRGVQGAKGEALAGVRRQELDRALTEVNSICEEVLDLNFRALALGQRPPAYDGRCPFRGLYPFRMEDREFFFGREVLVKDLQQKLGEHNFLAVLGGSGSGKSSLVLAGLIPALQAIEPELQMAYLTPGDAPLARLDASLSPLYGQSLVLVVDQFEELFTLCPEERQRHAFVDRLLALAKDRRLVVTMRADFWGECAPYRDLKEIMQAHQELIAPMDGSELRRAIELQAKKVGQRFEADLSNTILGEVRGEPGAMPLLQHTLLELWKRRHGRWLRAAEYQAMGGVKQAIAHTAEDVYAELSEKDRERVRDIFARLTRLDEEALQGEERRDTRRRVGAEEFAPAGSDRVITQSLIKRLADARLVVTSVNAINARQEVEVAHEALLRYWPRLRGWLADDQANLRWREGIRQAALEWRAGNRDDSLLVHRGSRLEDADERAQDPKLPLNQLEREYLDACRTLRAQEEAAKEDQRRREIEVAQKLAEQAEARRGAEEAARREAERRAAEQQRRAEEGLSRQLAAQAISRLDDAFDLALLLSVEANIAFDTFEARSALFNGLQHHTYLKAFLQGLIERMIPTVKPYRNPAIAFSPDGKALVSVGGMYSSAIILWDLTTQHPSGHPLNGHEGPVNVVAFSPDGRTVASASQSTIILWDVSTRQPIGPSLTGHTRPELGITSLAFSPDAKMLASGGHDNAVLLWDVTKIESVYRLETNETQGISNVVFSPTGKFLAAVGRRSTSRANENLTVVWDLSTRQPIGELLDGEGLAFSPRVDLLALVDPTGQKVTLWDIHAHQSIDPIMTNDTWSITSVAFNPDGQTLALGSHRSIILWDLPHHRPVDKLLIAHTHYIDALAFSPDGTNLASIGYDDAIILWNIVKPRSLARLFAKVSGNPKIAFSPDGRTLASVSGRPSDVVLWDVGTSQPVHHENLGVEITDLAFNPAGNTLAMLTDERAVRMLNAGRGGVWHEPAIALDEVTAFAFSPNGDTLTLGRENGSIMLWNVSTQRPLRETLPTGQARRITAIAFNYNGSLLASGHEDGTIGLWDVSRGEFIGHLNGLEDDIIDLGFHPNGDVLISTTSNQTMFLWDVKTQRPISRFSTGSFMGGPLWAAYSPDGRLLAWATIDMREIILQDEKGRQRFGQPLIYEGSDKVWSFAFSPDGKTFASAYADGAIIFWDFDIQSWQEQACAIANRDLTPEEWEQYLGGAPYRKTYPIPPRACSELLAEPGTSGP